MPLIDHLFSLGAIRKASWRRTGKISGTCLAIAVRFAEAGVS
jgi:hypothetical protein